MQEHQIDIPSQLKLWAETLGVEESHIVASSGEFLYKQWREDLENSKYGYPLQPVAQSAYLEDSLGKIIGNFEYKKRTPAIFLTHDVDYLNPTYILWLKKAIGRKKFSLDCFKDNFLDSLKRYLEVDKNFLKDSGGQLFIPAPRPPRGFKKYLIHKLIDPSYNLNSTLGDAFYKIVMDYRAEVGIHGSFFSLENDGNFKLEKRTLEQRFGRKITFNRQHWLNINSYQDLIAMHESGINFDSSLGWNGTLGIRGGFLRPYPILLDKLKVIWEIPMLLMDGVLFDELKLSPEKALAIACDWLQKVAMVGGCVAINWHERTFARSYGWGETYERILEWCKKEGFDFYSRQDIEQRIKEHEGKYISKTN